MEPKGQHFRKLTPAADIESLPLKTIGPRSVSRLKITRDNSSIRLQQREAVYKITSRAQN